MRLVCIITLVSIAVCAFAAYVLIADSNSEKAETDARLEQKVTVKVVGQPLADFLTDLSAKTGVRIASRADVSDLKVSVLVTELPLGELLWGVEDVLHLQHVRDGKRGEWHYELYEDAQTKAQAQRAKSRLSNALARQMDHAADVLKLPEEQIAQKVKEDKLLEPFIGQKEFRTAVAAYASLDARRRARLWDTKIMHVSVPDLPDPLRQEVLGIFNENRRQREKSEGIEFTGVLDLAYFEVQDDPLSGKALWFHLMGSDNHGMTLIFMPSPESGPQLVGNEDLFTLTAEEDKILGTIYKVVPKQLEGRLAEQSKVKFEKAVPLPQALVQVADAEDIDFIGDFFMPRYVMSSIVEDWTLVQGNTLAHLLEKIAGVFGCRWKMRGSTCLISSKQWFEDRDSDIPPRVIHRWQEAVRTKGRLELSELTEIASLRDRQLRGLQFYGLRCPGGFFENLMPLRFAATLAPGEWELASSEKGLQATHLSEGQKRAFVHWMEYPVGPDKRPSRFSEADADSATIHIKQQHSDTWAFGFETPDGRTRLDTLRLK